MRPKYYKACSDTGKQILIEAGFPFPEYLEKECLDIIELLGNDFYIGNCLKYLWRLGNKQTAIPWLVNKHIEKDLLKARVYLELYFEKNFQFLEADKVNYEWYFKLREKLMEY